MSLLNEIINDSKVLTLLRDENPTIEVNIIFPTFDDIFLRISPLYQGVYPELNKDNHNLFIQLIEDLHCLNSSKITELLVLLHFYQKKEKILEKLNIDILAKYSSVSLEKSLKLTLSKYGFIDLLKVGKYKFNQVDLNNVCCMGSLPVVKFIIQSNTNRKFMHTMQHVCSCNYMDIAVYIWEFLKEQEHDITSIFICACKSGNLELIKWVWQLGNIDLHIDNEDPFKNVCYSYNLDAIKYVWELGYKDNVGIINIHIFNEEIFEILCSQDKIEIVEWIWQLSLRDDVGKIDIHVNDDRIFRNFFSKRVINEDNLDVLKYILRIGNFDRSMEIVVYNSISLQFLTENGFSPTYQFSCIEN